MKTQGDRVVQSWLIAAVGLIAVGMLWIVIAIPNEASPWFGLMLFGAGIIVGVLAYVLGLIRR